MASLQERVYQVGLFAQIPLASPNKTLQAVSCLVKGGMFGIILPWHKQLEEIIKQIRAQFPQILIGVQGPSQTGQDVFAAGADFMVGGLPPKNATQGPFLLRKNSQLYAGKKPVAQYSGKLVLVSDLQQNKWDKIIARAQQAIEQMLGFTLCHVGINHPSVEDSLKTARQFEHFFGFPKVDKGGAFFAGPYIESMKKMFYGAHGHIAIGTNCPTRAAWYLAQRGARFNWKSADCNPWYLARGLFAR